MSGLNTLDKPNLFFLDITELRQTLKICVKECPSRIIHNRQDLYTYYKETNNHLCRYDFNMTVLLEKERKDLKLFDFLGPCPKLPVYKR